MVLFHLCEILKNDKNNKSGERIYGCQGREMGEKERGGYKKAVRGILVVMETFCNLSVNILVVRLH